MRIVSPLFLFLSSDTADAFSSSPREYDNTSCIFFFTLFFSSRVVFDDLFRTQYGRRFAFSACAAGVVTKTTDRDSLRYTYNGTRRVRQLALGCESN